MDKSWMKKDRLSHEYEKGVDSFIEFAQIRLSSKTSIRCPCVKCGNCKMLNTKEVKNHSLIYGMT